MKPSIAVGVTGASGAIYAMRTIAALMEVGCHLEIVFSDYGKRLLMEDLTASTVDPCDFRPHRQLHFSRVVMACFAQQ